MTFFSVIIPVYNVEKYLNECVDSVLNQTYKEIEVILVDDGSTDLSSQLCDDYLKKDNRVKVIHKENGGASTARNIGIINSSGEYLLFLDSDDYWDDSDALYNLHLRINNNNKKEDVIISLATLLYPDQSKRCDREFASYQGLELLNSEKAVEKMISEGIFPGSACTVALKREFFIRNDLFFVEGIKSEDIEWAFRLAYCSPLFGFPDQRFYVYRKNRQGSVTSTIDYSHLCQYVDIVENVQRYDFKSEEQKDSLLSLAAYHLAIIMGLTMSIKNPNEREKIIARIIKNRNLFDYTINNKARKVSILQKIIGVSNTCRLLGLYIQLK